MCNELLKLGQRFNFNVTFLKKKKKIQFYRHRNCDEFWVIVISGYMTKKYIDAENYLNYEIRRNKGVHIS